MASSSTRPEQQLSAGQAAPHDPTNNPPDQSGVPRVDVPISSEFAIDLNSPSSDSQFADALERPEDQQSPTAAGDHQDNIPLQNMAAAQSGDTVTGLSEPQTTSGANVSSTIPINPSNASSSAEVPQQQAAVETARQGADELNIEVKDPGVFTTIVIPNTEFRHSWKISTDYLRRRGETVPRRNTPDAALGDELLDIPIATIKRLLIADWRSEWESPPTGASQIRLISMGALLDDERTLRDYNFLINAHPRPILLTVRRPPEEEQEGDGDGPNKVRTGGNDDETRSRSCGCCIIM